MAILSERLIQVGSRRCGMMMTVMSALSKLRDADTCHHCDSTMIVATFDSHDFSLEISRTIRLMRTLNVRTTMCTAASRHDM